MENSRTKLRILYLYLYLTQNTSAEHPESTVELMKMLEEQYGIKVSRNTISDDLSMLCDKHFQIKIIHSTQNKYYYDGNVFDISEMKILLDAVSSAKFLTESKSELIINKLLTLISPEDAIKLRRHIYAADRVKSENESGYQIVDVINEAIDSRRKISFYYTDFDVDKKRILTNNGAPYTVSPYTLMWDGDFYYLRGYCDERNVLRTFRVDRMESKPMILRDLIVQKPDGYNIAEYSKSVFRTYDTDEPIIVNLSCNASTMKFLIEMFGSDVDTTPIDEDSFHATIKVCASPTFFRWVFGFGGAISIQGPKTVLQKYRKMLQSAEEAVIKAFDAN